MLSGERMTWSALVQSHILKDGLAAMIPVSSHYRVFNSWRHAALHALARLMLCGDFNLLKSSSAVAGIFSDLVFTRTALATLRTMAIVDVATDKFLHAIII